MRCVEYGAKNYATGWKARGLAVRPTSWRALAEETADANKDVDAVSAVTEGAEVARMVACLYRPGS